MDTNETGREPTKPTDAELLRDWANKGRLRLDRAEDHSTFDQYHLACIADADAHRAAMARGREYLSGQRPMPGSEVSRAEVLRMSTDTLLKAEAERMPDTPAPDEVAQPAQFPIGWNEMPPEDVLRAEAKVSLWMREHRITDWALGHSASREMLNRLTARIDDLERENAALRAERDGHRGLVNRLQRVRIAAFHLVDNAQEHLDNTGATIFDPWYSDLCDALDEYEAAVSAGKEAPDAE